ncbi:hypothetical protein L6164_035885 [Bauhinia variegata]|uniref:Uncharacterized protein n=1 Tax=Bauhinia variegata TaxID=167791 RepID=A0ACB9KG79_BAUVA|nr:hypothetical protein L6164_035885 [Bauhinia variegata]
MGNCCGQHKRTSSMEWGGEDWGSLTSSSKSDTELNTWEAERESLLGALKASSDENGKLKIRISKKELEDLMAAGKTEKWQQQGLSMEQVLLLLINASGRADEHHGQWRPVLRSIPEVN